MTRWAARVVSTALLAVAAGCATAPVERPARPTAEGEQEITIEAVRFTFVPDVVTAKAGVPLTITALSRSGIPHNLTIVTPDGQFLEGEDMPAGRRVTIRTLLPRPGRYVFYCAVRFHRRPFGMAGVLVAR